MLNLSQRTWFKTVAIVLVITFLALDASWAYPPDPSTSSGTLSTETPFSPMTPNGMAMKREVFLEASFQGYLGSIAKYLLVDKLPIGLMEETLMKQGLEASFNIPAETFLDDKAGVEGIALSQVVEKDGVITIPYAAGTARYDVEVIAKDSVPVKDAASYIDVNGKYAARRARRLCSRS